MRTKMIGMLLLTGGLSVVAPGLRQAEGAAPFEAALSVSGTLKFDQSTPFGCNDVHQQTTVTAGVMGISPAEGSPVSGGRLFVLTGGTIAFAPITLESTCFGVDHHTRDYTELGVQIPQAVSFVATPTGPSTYAFTIPAASVLLYEAATVDGGPERAYSHPKQDVTGSIDLGAGTVQMQVVCATKIHVEPLGDFDGTVTADLTGQFTFPDKDGDGVPDPSDNCPLVANPDQTPVPNPTITAPPPITVLSCLDHSIGTASAADVCYGDPVAVANNAPAVFHEGSNTVTWTATDTHAQTASATQAVKVIDKTPPTFTFVPGDITVNDCGPVDVGHATAVDDCAEPVRIHNDAPFYFHVGATTVTWVARDDERNRTKATQVVTVVDTHPPELWCKPVDDDDHAPWHKPGSKHDDDDDLFRVSTKDRCTAYPKLRLGGFTLENGEVIKLTPTHLPGVKFVGFEHPGHVRHFLVGPGAAVVTSTDGSGNVATAGCPVPPPHR